MAFCYWWFFKKTTSRISSATKIPILILQQSNFVAQEEYKFGDVTKKAMGKAMDAITSFTGKEDTF